MVSTRNILSNWGAFAFAAAVNFVLTPFVIRSLGNTSYGVWVLLVALVGYLGYLDLGVRGAVTRFVARHHGAADHASASRVASTALTTFALAGALAILLSGVLAVTVGHAARVPIELRGEARIVLLLGGLNIAGSLLCGVFGGIVIGMQRFDYANGVEIGAQALRALLIVAALKAGYGLVALATIQLGIAGLRGVTDFLVSRRLYPELKLRLGEWDRATLKVIFGFGVAATLLQVLGGMALYGDSLVIGAFLPLGLITFFAIASGLTEYARALVGGVSQTVSPLASALDGRGQEHRVQEALVSGARLAMLVVTPVAITFLLRGPAFIALWMGTDYRELSGAVLRILTVALWAVSGYQVVTATVMGIGRHQGLVPAFLAEVVCNVALSVWWVRPYGIVGVAWGTTVPRLAFSLLFAPWYARRALAIPMQRLWLSVWVRPTLAMVPFALATYTIERFWPADNLPLYFTQVVMVLPLALVAAWFTCFSVPERRAVAVRLKLFARPVGERL